MTGLTQKINAAASLTFSTASGSSHREAKESEEIFLEQQPHVFPGSCTSPSLAPSLCGAASNVYRKIKWTRRLFDLIEGWLDLMLPIPDEWVNGGCHVVTGTSSWLIFTPCTAGWGFCRWWCSPYWLSVTPIPQHQGLFWYNLGSSSWKRQQNSLCFGIAMIQETRLK